MLVVWLVVLCRPWHWCGAPEGICGADVPFSNCCSNTDIYLNAPKGEICNQSYLKIIAHLKYWVRLSGWRPLELSYFIKKNEFRFLFLWGAVAMQFPLVAGISESLSEAWNLACRMRIFALNICKRNTLIKLHVLCRKSIFNFWREKREKGRGGDG